ncbi:hypothetical protein ACJJTC_016342 [Scirpophaga incertulas]
MELLQNDVEITGVEEQKSEGLSHVVFTLANKLGEKLEQQDVVSAVRIGRMESGGETAGRPRPIVVRLVRRVVRDDLLRAARVRRGATTEGTGVPGAPRRFCINERLTRSNRLLFRRAREAGNRLKWNCSCEYGYALVAPVKVVALVDAVAAVKMVALVDTLIAVKAVAAVGVIAVLAASTRSVQAAPGSRSLAEVVGVHRAMSLMCPRSRT